LFDGKIGGLGAFENLGMSSPATESSAKMSSDPCRHEKEYGVSEQEHSTEDEQRPHAEEQYLVAELTDQSADIVCPEWFWSQKPSHSAGNEQAEDVEIALGIPRLPVPDKPRRQGPH
jgi:hypothetical protein